MEALRQAPNPKPFRGPRKGGTLAGTKKVLFGSFLQKELHKAAAKGPESNLGWV